MPSFGGPPESISSTGMECFVKSKPEIKRAKRISVIGAVDLMSTPFKRLLIVWVPIKALSLN
jgi:hypothetical protein